MTPENVVEAINHTRVAEVVKFNANGTQIRITHRVHPKRLRVWLDVITYVLSRKQGWEAHISKQYYLRDGRLIHGWNFIAQWSSADQAEDVMKQIVALLNQASKHSEGLQYQLESYPLVAREGRNAPTASFNVRAPGPMSGGGRQKGAHRIGGKL